MHNSLNRELARILTSHTVHAQSVQSVKEYAEKQIERINKELQEVDPSNIGEVASLQGQFKAFKQLTRLREEVQAVMQGDG